MSTEIIIPTVKMVVEEIVSGIAIPDSGYSVLDRGEKARVRNAIVARKNSALRDGKFDVATEMLEIENAFKNVRNNRVEIDPVDELRNVIRYSAYVLSEMISGAISPDGIDPVDLSEEFDFDFTAMVAPTMENGEATVFDFDPEIVKRFIPRRIRRNGPQNDIPGMIHAVFENVESGEFLRVSDIRKRISEMELGNADSSWDGRISAALFSDNWNDDSVIPQRDFPWNNSTRNGATKA